MPEKITVRLSKQAKDRLTRVALRYGLSLGELSRHVLEEVGDGIPTESLSDYERPKSIEWSLRRALQDWRAGRVRRKL